MASGRSDPGDARGLHRRGEVGVLREEAEPGVKRISGGDVGRSDDRLDVQEVDGAGPVGRRLDGLDSQAIARSADAAGDLAAVGDEEPPDRPDAVVIRRGGRAFTWCARRTYDWRLRLVRDVECV